MMYFFKNFFFESLNIPNYLTLVATYCIIYHEFIGKEV